MSLHLAASLSYDVVILAFTGYFTAVCLDLAYKAETVKVGDVIALAVVMAVMGPCKWYMVPLQASACWSR